MKPGQRDCRRWRNKNTKIGGWRGGRPSKWWDEEKEEWGDAGWENKSDTDTDMNTERRRRRLKGVIIVVDYSVIIWVLECL